jgi:protein O-mannosyl-transferase
LSKDTRRIAERESHTASALAVSSRKPLMTGRAFRVSSIAALVALPFVIYSNGYRHAFQLDDAYTVVSNPAVRSLRNIPRFFADPATYTSIREQADYRPLLQVTYALDYALGGYNQWWWHFTQVLLHVIVTLGVFVLCRRILTLLGDKEPDRIAVFATLLFAIHPDASGVVMYSNARSSLLTAAFLLPALIAYMKPIESAEYDRPQWLAAAFYTLALFTKVEAVGALGALWAYELWQRGRAQPMPSLFAGLAESFDARTRRRIAPMLVVTIVYFIIRWRVMAPFPTGSARHAADVGPYQYLLTQLTAWWYYVGRWLAPVRLVADYLAYPVYRSWREPVVLLAAGGWLVVLTLLVSAWRRAPYLLFIAIAALAIISPTSSIAPLAEMVNEHRPYLPMGILSLALIIPAGRALRQWPQGNARVALGSGLAVVSLAFATLTYQRNRVFETAESYWADVLSTAPSPRAELNYGLALMERNDMPGALKHYRASLDVAPYWYFTHINLAIAFQHIGQIDSARVHFDRAVEYDQYSGLALTWRGEFHLAQREYGPARDDFLRTLPISLERYRNTRGLAFAYAGLGDTAQAQAQVRQLLALDSVAAANDSRLISGMPAGGAGTATSASGRTRLASSSADEQAGLMSLGLSQLSRGDAAGAAAVFRRVLALNPTHYGANYQLAVALDRLGRAGEARVVWEQVQRMAEGYNDAATAGTARARWSRRP